MGEKLIKGDKKMGKMHILPPIGKKYAYFSQIEIYKIEKKAANFSPAEYEFQI